MILTRKVTVPREEERVTVFREENLMGRYRDVLAVSEYVSRRSA